MGDRYTDRFEWLVSTLSERLEQGAAPLEHTRPTPPVQGTGRPHFIEHDVHVVANFRPSPLLQFRESHLLCGVLLRAIDDILLLQSADILGTPHHIPVAVARFRMQVSTVRRIQADAASYLFLEEYPAWLYSCQSICDVLGMERSVLRHRIARHLGFASATTCQGFLPQLLRTMKGLPLGPPR